MVLALSMMMWRETTGDGSSMLSRKLTAACPLVHPALALYIANRFQFRHFFCDSLPGPPFLRRRRYFVCQSGFRRGPTWTRLDENAVLFHVPEQLFAADRAFGLCARHGAAARAWWSRRCRMARSVPTRR